MTKTILITITCIFLSGCMGIIKREAPEPLPANLKALVPAEKRTFSLETSFNAKHNSTCEKYEKALRDEISEVAGEMGLVQASSKEADYIFSAYFDRCGGFDADSHPALMAGISLSAFFTLGIIPMIGPSETSIDLTIRHGNSAVFKNRSAARHYDLIGLVALPLMIIQKSEKPEILEVHNAIARQFKELEVQGGL